MKKMTIINFILSVVLLIINIVTLVHNINVANNIPTCVGPAPQMVNHVYTVYTDSTGNVDVEVNK